MQLAGEFESRLKGRARAERHPISCTFEITPTCNLRCHFCYVALDPYEGPYLSTEEIVRIFGTLQRAGVLWLTLTGGEVLSRRDFPAIYRAAREHGFLVTVFTNGTMVTEAIAKMFAEEPPLTVEVSIYGADAEHYEATTQIPGSYARFERGVQRLIDAGVSLTLKTPLSTFTQDHLPALVDWARSRNVPFKFDPMLEPRHDGNNEPTFYRIAPRRVKALGEEVAALKTKIAAEMMAAGGASPARPLPECTDTDGARADELYQCGAGRIGLFIDGNGMASHCVIDREPRFDVLGMEWDDLWAQMGAWVTQPLPADAPCSGCGMRHECGNCPARARLSTGSPYLKDTYHCDITHLTHGLDPAVHPDYRAVAARKLSSCAV